MANKLSKNYKVHGQKLFDQLGQRGYLEYVYKGETLKEYQILAMFCLMKAYKFDTYDQLDFFFKRYKLSAQRLKVFSLDKIRRTIDYLVNNKDLNFKIGLETVEKYILEIDTIEGYEPILILKDGTEVNDIKELKKLETEGKIYYSNDKWHEKN